MSQGPICLVNTHTHTHTQRVMIPSVSLLFKQLQTAVTACVGSFTEKQSFQALAFLDNFHPGYIPGLALCRLCFFPCLVSISPFFLSYPLLRSAMGTVEPAVSCLLMLWMGEQCVATAKSVWMDQALQHWGLISAFRPYCVWCYHPCLQRRQIQ